MRPSRWYAAIKDDEFGGPIRPMDRAQPFDPDGGYAAASGNYVPRPAGTYAKYPQVTWDLAAERWTQGRCRHVVAFCRTCRWLHCEAVLAKPEREIVAELIIEAQHWYSCKAGDPQVEFTWWNTTNADRHI